MKKAPKVSFAELQVMLPTITKKTNLGDGLYITVKKNGEKEFQYRRFINGQDHQCHLGNVKNLRIEDARKKIDELNATIQDKIDNKKKKDIVASIQKKKVKAPKMPCFRSLSDAKKFVEKLIAKAPIQPFQLQNSHVDEIYAITWLMLLTPLTLKQIIDAKWGSIAYGVNIDKDMPFPRWIFNMSGGHRNSLKQSLLIGPMRHNLPIKRHQTANDYIFPNIAKDVKQAQKDIELKMKEIFDDYPINPEHFTSFFRHVAIRYSCYKSEFIDAYIKMQHGDKYWASMRTELDNLSMWWHGLVTVNKFSYAEENSPPNNQGHVVIDKHSASPMSESTHMPFS